MLYTIFDLETTGLDSKCDDVIQFSAVTVTPYLLPVKSYNLYFYKGGMSWSEEAEAVHGLSQKFLKQYEVDYEKNLLLMYSLLERGTLVGYNSDTFDIPFARSFLCRNGLGNIYPGRTIDVMKVWQEKLGKRYKLTNLPQEIGVTEDSIKAYASLAFKDTELSLRPHDATYDVAATSMCLSRAIRSKVFSL